MNPSLPTILGRQDWVWALSGQDQLELQVILYRTPNRSYAQMDEAYVLAQLSRHRRAHGEPRKRQNVMTAGMGQESDPAFAWLTEQEWARYKELTK